MGIICKKVIERYESGAVKQYAGTYELDEAEAVQGIKAGDYIAVGYGDGVLPDGVESGEPKSAPVVEDEEGKDDGKD